MKPVMQNVFGIEGNCLSATIASLMHLNIEDVPNFNIGAEPNTTQDDPAAVKIFWDNVEKFLNSKGYSIIHFEPKGVAIEAWIGDMKGYFLVGGESPRGYQHSVIYTNKGLAHDPHPEGGGVIPESISIIYPLFI